MSKAKRGALGTLEVKGGHDLGIGKQLIAWKVRRGKTRDQSKKTESQHTKTWIFFLECKIPAGDLLRPGKKRGLLVRKIQYRHQ